MMDPSSTRNPFPNPLDDGPRTNDHRGGEHGQHESGPFRVAHDRLLPRLEDRARDEHDGVDDPRQNVDEPVHYGLLTTRVQYVYYTKNTDKWEGYIN